jgi:hypothetical protein
MGPHKKLEPYGIGPAIQHLWGSPPQMKTANAKKDKGLGFLK